MLALMGLIWPLLLELKDESPIELRYITKITSYESFGLSKTHSLSAQDLVKFLID